MNAAARRRKTPPPPTHTELMRQMGSPSGAWNPLPPDQHLFAVHHPEIAISSNVLQSIQWVQWKCVDDKPGGRTAKTRDERGDLTVVHMAEHFGWDVSNASKIAAAGEELGFYWRDPKGVFHMNALVNPDGRNKGETSKPGGMYKPVPEYLAAHIKGLSEKDRESFLQGWTAAETWHDDALAQAKVAIYQRKIERQKELCRHIGAELKTGGGRPRDEEHQEPIVQLTFILEPGKDRFVQTSGVQTNGAGLNKSKSENVQGPVSLLGFSEKTHSRQRVSKEPTAAEFVETAQPPPPAPLTSENPSQEGKAEEDVALEPVEGIFGKIAPTDPLRAEFTGLAAEFGIPPASVSRAIYAKIAEKRQKCYPIESRKALLDFVRAGMPAWIFNHPDDIRRAQRDLEQRERDREQSRHVAADPPDIEELRQQLAEVLKDTAMKAGHS